MSLVHEIESRFAKGSFQHEHFFTKIASEYSKAIFVKEGNGIVSVDAKTRGLVQVLKHLQIPHGRQGDRYRMPEKYVSQILWQTTGYINPVGKTQFLCTALDSKEKVKIEIAREIGVPLKALEVEKDARTYVAIRGGRYPLVRSYSKIVDLFPYDLDAQEAIVDLLDEAYDHSINSFDHLFLKVDYDLVVLGNYKEFGRLQVEPTIDYQRPRLPRYWYDLLDFTGVESAEDLMDVLAIEKSWSDPKATRYLVRCGFPAGSMFLRASVEAQKTTRGGGIEYQYIGVVSPETGKPHVGFSRVVFLGANSKTS